MTYVVLVIMLSDSDESSSSSDSDGENDNVEMAPLRSPSIVQRVVPLHAPTRVPTLALVQASFLDSMFDPVSVSVVKFDRLLGREEGEKKKKK